MKSPAQTAVFLTTVVVSTLIVVACTSATSNTSPKISSSTDVSSRSAVPSAPVSTHASTATQQGPAAAPLPPGTVTIPVPGYTGLGELAVASDALWLGDGPFRIDQRHNTIGKPLSGQLATDVGASGHSLWVSDYNGVVRRYDATTGKLVATVRLPSGETPEGIAIGANGVWVASHHGGTLDRIDPRTNKLAKRIPVTRPGDSGAQFVTTGFGSVWVGVGNDETVVRVDPRSNKVLAKISLRNQMEPCGGLAATSRAIWVSECLDGTHVGRIDPRTNTVTKVLDTGGKVIWMAAERDTVWFVTGGDPDYSPDAPGYLVQLRDDGTYLRRYTLGDGFTSGSVAIAFGSIWVTSSNKPVVLRIALPTR